MGENRNDWLDNALQPLKTASHAHPWPSTDDVKRRAARHRQRRMAAVTSGTGLVFAIVLVIGLVVASNADHSRGPVNSALSKQIQAVAGPDGSVHLVTDVRGTSKYVGSPSMSAVALAEQTFALQLTREELSQSSSDNVLLSPMSADIDLAMLELGSTGQTAHEVATALSSSGFSASDQADGWSGLEQELMAAESAGELHLANSIWVDKDITVEPEFLREAASTFGDDTYQVNFASGSATNAINAWVDQETAGRIKQLYGPGDLSPLTEVLLANALHFHAVWQDQLFKEALPEPEPFFTSAGARVRVEMLVDNGDSFLSSETPTYDAVQLPYSNGRFAALLIEPTSGSMSSFLRTLSPAHLSTLTTSLRDEVVDLSMPELALSAKENLAGSLSAMGMAQVFQSANFSPMLGPSGASFQAVGSVQQAASLDVDQWGTDAAAATGVNVIPTDARASSATISFNHPYLFLIRDTKTGTILFSSVVNNPAAG